jgi:hypothetical protein
MDEPRKGHRISLDDLATEAVALTSKPKSVTAPTMAAAVADARAAGFTGRADGVKIDGRTLRRTGRTAQINFRVTPETRDAIVKAASSFPSTEDFFKYVLENLVKQP